MSSARQAPTENDDPDEQETRRCATCGTVVTEMERPKIARRDFRCKNDHRGTITQNGHEQGPVFEILGDHRMMTDGGTPEGADAA